MTPTKLSEPNHYAIAFPLRPGQSRFQISYTLPYSGSLKLAQKPWLPTGAVIVMMPKSACYVTCIWDYYGGIVSRGPGVSTVQPCSFGRHVARRTWKLARCQQSGDAVLSAGESWRVT